MVVVGGLNSCLGQGIVVDWEVMVLFIYQQGFDFQVFWVKGVWQIVFQGMCFVIWQMNVQCQFVVQFVYKLMVMIVWCVVYCDSVQGGFVVQSGVVDGVLFCVNGLLYGSVEKFYIVVKVLVVVDVVGDSFDVKMRKVGVCVGSGKWQQCKSQCVFVQICCMLQCCYLIGFEQCWEMWVGEYWGDGCLQICCQSC